MTQHQNILRQIGITAIIGVAIIAGLFASSRSQAEEPQMNTTEFTDERAAFDQALTAAQARGSGPETSDLAPATIQGSDETNINASEDSFNELSVTNTTTNDAPFPHPALYGGMNSSAWPFVGTIGDTRPPDGAPLNSAVLDAYARFPHVILPATPMTDLRPDIMTALRQRNPNITIFAYVMAHTTWCPDSGNGNISYPVGTYFRDYWISVNAGSPSCTPSQSRFLWLQNGHLASDVPYDVGINVNLAHRVQNPDSSYRYDVAEGIADTIYAHAKRSKGVDGIFIDVYCSGILWMEHADTDPTSFDNSIYFDYAKAGFGSDNSNPANRAAFDSAWAGGHQALANRLRSLADADGDTTFPISGNCGQAGASLHPVLNGWMRENYPFQNGATFYTNMLTWPWGFLYQDKNFRSPQFNYIFTAAQSNGTSNGLPTFNPYDSTNLRKMRFGLGSASLGNGYAAFHDSSGDPLRGLWFDWWYDEYGVKVNVPQSDPTYGTAMEGPQYNGWLGQPLGDYTQMVYRTQNLAPDLVTANLSFETAGASPSQIPGWSFINFSPSVATLTRDTTTAAVGSASAKIHIDVGNDTATYAVNIHPSQTFSVSAFQQYSVSFWAKASANRTVDVTLWNGGSIQASLTIPITTEWKQYQAVLKPTSSFTATFDFDLGRATGDIWFDDVHMQLGTSSVYRRDFDRGIVLLNPNDAAQTVTLEKPYKKILGSASPTLNDGSTVSTVTIPGGSSGGGVGDALFLLTIDHTAPAAIDNLAATGP